MSNKNKIPDVRLLPCRIPTSGIYNPIKKALISKQSF
jgi:hypothetical protein